MSGVNTCTVVNKLGFLVKPGRQWDSLRPRIDTRFAAWLAASVLWIGGCGYHPAYGGKRPDVRLSVSAAPSRAPESGALAGVLAGLRAELSRAGVLNPRHEYPRVVVELVRVEERGTAQTLARDDAGRELPLAGGALVGVTARAWVQLANGQVERDTGDVRRTSAFRSQVDPGFDSAQREAALGDAARAVGEALGRRVMGEIEVAQEPM